MENILRTGRQPVADTRGGEGGASLPIIFTEKRGTITCYLVLFI